MSTLRKIIDDYDKSKDAAAEVKQTLALLMSLAEAKANEFEAEIKENLQTGKTYDTLEIPIEKEIQRTIDYRAVTQNTPEDIIKNLTDALSDMISDPSGEKIIGGIGKIVNQGLTVILGAAEGTEQVSKIYCVTADYPAIVRFDFAFWCRNIVGESIKKYVEHALACVAIKSSVDVNKLSYNTFLSVYNRVLKAAYGNDPKDIDAMLEKARRIYDNLRDPSKVKEIPFRPDFVPQLVTVLPATKPSVGNF